MEVHEAYLALQKLMMAGKGKNELIFRDQRSGDTGSVSISSTIEIISMFLFIAIIKDNLCVLYY